MSRAIASSVFSRRLRQRPVGARLADHEIHDFWVDAVFYGASAVTMATAWECSCTGCFSHDAGIR